MALASIISLTFLVLGEPTGAVRPDLEVALHTDGGMTDSPHYFLLKVNFSGEVEGGGDLNPGVSVPRRKLPAGAHARLAELLKRERFFTMRGVGNCPADLGHRSIEAWQGTKKHTVVFCLGRGDVQLREAQAVLRIWYGVLALVGSGERVVPTGVDKELLEKQP
jgi:hypothetical protein